MNNKILGCLMAAALSTTFALASPALARGGGGGGGHGGGGGGHGGGMGGGMHGGGVERRNAWPWAAAPHFSAIGGGPRFASSHFAGNHFAHVGGFHNGRFFHHRHVRFAFIGAPYAYAL